MPRYSFIYSLANLNIAVIALSVVLSSCVIFEPVKPIESLKGRVQPRVIVSEQKPYDEYICESLGFLPCSLGDTKKPPEQGREYLQCAENILSYAEKMGTNYIHITSPLQLLGVTWQDSKANLYNCLYLPQPSPSPLHSTILAP